MSQEILNRTLEVINLAFVKKRDFLIKINYCDILTR